MSYGSVLLTDNREEFGLSSGPHQERFSKSMIKKASFVLGCELWMGSFDSLFALVKEYIINLWEGRKVKLCGETCSTQFRSQSSAGDPRDGTVDGGQRRGTCKFSKFSHSGGVTGKLSMNDDLLCVSSCTSGSTHLCGCVVKGMIARAAS